MGVVVAVVIAPEVLHAGLHVKRMRGDGRAEERWPLQEDVRSK
jgi:hypothetical protein